MKIQKKMIEEEIVDKTMDFAERPTWRFKKSN